MMWNPFRSPENYSEMLQKIGFFTFVAALGFTILLSGAIPSISIALDSLKVPVDVLGISIPVLYPAVALGFAGPAHVIKLHDRVSDLFGIREAFDIHEILVPLAGGTGIPTTVAFLKRLREGRDNVMNGVFYKYADSSASSPAVQKHLIVTALNTWTWYWILVEASVVAIVALAILLAWNSWHSAAWVATGLVLCFLILPFLKRWCASHAHAQVEQILSDADRLAAVRGTLNAL
jgi:hypothetical protein